MTPHVLRYTVQPDQLAQNEELLAAVFAELEELRPAGLRYAVFKLADGVSFLHFISLEKKGRPSPLSRLTALRAFHDGLRDRCLAGPTRTEITELGTFGFPGPG